MVSGDFFDVIRATNGDVIDLGVTLVSGPDLNGDVPDFGQLVIPSGSGEVLRLTVIATAKDPTKTLISTSESDTLSTDVLVGEIVRYRLQFEVTSVRCASDSM